MRSKENRRVEFGAKVNNIQIDGISFIEHHSFEAFNEGVRLRQCVEYRESFGIHMANATALAARQLAKELKERKRQTA